MTAMYAISAVQTAVESRPAGKIHNGPQIGVDIRLKLNNTRRQHMYTFWQSVEHSPSKAIVFQGAQLTNTSMIYNVEGIHANFKENLI